MKFKKLMVSFLAATMCATMIPAVVLADETDNNGNDVAVVEDADAKEDDKVAKLSSSPLPYSGQCGAKLYYELQSDGTLLFSGSGTMYNYPANKAPWAGFKNKITGIAFSGKVTSIGNYAFYGCKGIKTVTITSSITSIGTGAFYGAGVTKVAGGAGLKTIGASAFKNTKSLKTFYITSKTLSKIGSQAFYGSAVTKLTIKNTTKLTRKGVKKSLKGSKVKTVDVKNSKKIYYGAYFVKSNSGKKVKVK